MRNQALTCVGLAASLDVVALTMRSGTRHPSPPAARPASRAGPAARRRGGRQARHVAIVLEGGRRWAEEHGLSAPEALARGLEALSDVVSAALDRGISVLSLCLHPGLGGDGSSLEAQALPGCLTRYLSAEAVGLARRGVRLRLLAQDAGLPADLGAAVGRAEAAGAGAGRLTLNLALASGRQEELVQAVRGLAREAAGGRLSPEGVDAPGLEARLQSSGVPPVDLLICTGGRRRLPGFLVWQSAYAELLFLDVLWPDFSGAHLERALEDFAHRRRTFGGLVDPQGEEA